MQLKLINHFGTSLVARTLSLFAFGFPVALPEVSFADLSVERSEAGAIVKIDGELFAEYRTASGPQPAIWPIIGPTGRPITRSYPVGPALEHEEEDHPHHRSLWFAHGIVNGHDFWLNPKEELKDGLTNGIIHREFAKIDSDGQHAVIVTHNDWNSDGKKICEDERTVIFGAEGEMRWIDFTVEIRASEEDVTFGDTKEGAFAVRVAGTMKVDARMGGRIVNSRGQLDSEAWGQPAEWVDYCGPLDGETVGIAILSHPSNDRHPCLWHVRNYGLFAANPFGQHHFPHSDVMQGAVTIPAGDSLTLRYRVVFHRCDTQEANIENVYRDFAAHSTN